MNIYTCYLLRLFYFSAILLLISCQGDSQSDAAVAPGTAGMGGSMARFTISGDYLYTVSNTNLKAFDIAQPTDPRLVSDIQVGVGIETIFANNNGLFIGSNDAMYIYDNSNPLKPVQLSRYGHVYGCDPVVVQGNYAYVTLRSGTGCRNQSINIDLLDVVDIRNLSSPAVVASYPMSNPHGLGVDGSTLFLCEGQYGLKVFDISKPTEPMLLQHLQDIHSYDVIAKNKLLLVIGNGGLYQFDYQNPKQLTLISKIPVEN